MNHKLFFLFFILSYHIIGQEIDSIIPNTIYHKIHSENLNSERKITIQLPRNYNINEENRYPVVYVFDGHYLFDLAAGNFNYMSFWNYVPNVIVVGIDQLNSRYNDVNILDNINYTPISSTAKFFEFISNELIPYIDSNYRTTNFRVAIGNESTANFINFFLIRKKTSIIDGYILISPKYSERMQENVQEYLKSVSKQIFYYVSTSTDDFTSISKNVFDFNKRLDSLKNDNVKYKLQNLENFPNSLFKSEFSHFNLASYTIPYSIADMFSLYRDISKKEYDSIILNLKTSPVKYLEEKYQRISEIYGIYKNISINDFMKIEDYIEETEKFNFFKDLSKLAMINYKETILPSYYMGRYYEETGNPRKAMHVYRSAYILEDFIQISKDYLMQRADAIEDDFDY